jgi:hypothetical protein
MNRRIFKSSSLSWQEVWAKIHSNIKETINLHPWMDQDWICPTNELIILNAWKLHLSPSLSSPLPGSTSKIIPSHWEAPQVGYHKINFDGASKGNPGPVGYGAAIHNNKGEILHLSAGNLGHNTNNAAEIWGLLKGLQAAKEQGLNLLIAEGDSQIVINLLTHLLNGADLRRSPQAGDF